MSDRPKLKSITISHLRFIVKLILLLNISIENYKRKKERGRGRQFSTWTVFFWETNTHTQGREKEVLIQRHTTTPLKSYSNF